MTHNQKKTILIVDDTEANIDMIMAILKDYDLIPAASGADALEVLQEEDVDLILLDIIMPEMDGFTVCHKIKADQKLKDTPIIFITAKNDEDTIEEAYKIGGIDYVTKPFRPRELLARVRTHLELKDSLRELEFLAAKDSLTNIYNRRKFFELAEQMFENSENLFAVMIDIDHFKRVNDDHGHSMGDVALKSISKTISDLLPKNAIFGRLGGEEFAILLETHSKEDAFNKIENIRIAVSEELIQFKDVSIQCTISNGIAEKNHLTKSLDDLFHTADKALYSAKSSGRNKAIFREQKID